MPLSLFALSLAGAALGAEVVHGATAPAYRILGGKGTATLLLNPSTGADAAALDVLVLQAGAEVAAHRHEGSVEILYILEGAVEMEIGGAKHAAGPGDAVYIPADVEHAARATKPVRAVQVYVGPGPEQRFTQGERVR